MSILIISDKESDLSRLLMNSAECEFLSEGEAALSDLSKYTALALLWGTNNERPHTTPAALRIKLEEFAESGKPIFYEWCEGFGYTDTVGNDYNDGSESSGDALNRYVYVGEDNEHLCYGDLLDSQANIGCVYGYIPKDAYPVLYNGGHILKHDRVPADMIDLTKVEKRKWRLWYYDSSRLVSSFRLCNFVKARFAPFKAWCGIIKIILNHLGIEKFEMPKPHYTLGSGGDALNTFCNGMSWFDGCDILINGGVDGASEGMSHPIFPDGVQEVRNNVRVDCVGEVAGAYFFDYLLNGSQSSLTVFKNLSDFIFDKMQAKSGRYAGMLRWTEREWNTVYGDDSGRAVLGNLLYMMYTGDTSRLGNIEKSFDFLVSVTGTDGLMHHGLRCATLTEEDLDRMRTTESKQYSAHRNAYYNAALLLAYKFNRKQIYLDTAVKGLSSIMGVFPNTMRAISETEELSRLVFPLSCLYEATGSSEHKAWLYEVCERLELYRHENGGYVEMDPGYTAYRSRTAGTESSMLADNGNEIAELLYSLNWLPLGFAYAYYVTRDELFLNKWKDIARFFADAQIVSEDKKISGAWSRSLDLKRMEIYGMPHDVGWGPCCIESGWTVGEVLMGLGLGIALERGIEPSFQGKDI